MQILEEYLSAKGLSKVDNIELLKITLNENDDLMNAESRIKHKELSPFYKHHNEQFLIQKNKVI